LSDSTNCTVGGCGFHHVAIRARSYDASVKFYTEALGFKTRVEWGDAPKRATMLDTGDGNYLEIFERPDQPPVDHEAAILHFALRTTDCDAALERARAAGAVVTMESKDVDLPAKSGIVPVRIAFCKGPDGEVIEFFENEVL